MEARAFDQDIDGAGLDFAVLAAHDARQRYGFGFVGDQEHLFRQHPLLAVEGDKFFAFGRTADQDGRDRRMAAQKMIIESVQGMAGLEHDVIGHIDHIVDGTQAGLFQSRTQPRRAGADLHAANDAGGVTGRQFRLVDADGHEFFGRLTGKPLRGDLDFGKAQRTARNCADFARDADDAVPIGSVGRDLQIIHDIRSRPSQIFREWLAHRSVRAQKQEALYFFG